MIELGKSGTNPNNLTSSSALGQQLRYGYNRTGGIGDVRNPGQPAKQGWNDLCTSQWLPLQLYFIRRWLLHNCLVDKVYDKLQSKILPHCRPVASLTLASAGILRLISLPLYGLLDLLSGLGDSKPFKPRFDKYTLLELGMPLYILSLDWGFWCEKQLPRGFDWSLPSHAPC